MNQWKSSCCIAKCPICVDGKPLSPRGGWRLDLRNCMCVGGTSFRSERTCITQNNNTTQVAALAWRPQFLGFRVICSPADRPRTSPMNKENSKVSSIFAAVPPQTPIPPTNKRGSFPQYHTPFCLGGKKERRKDKERKETEGKARREGKKSEGSRRRKKS